MRKLVISLHTSLIFGSPSAANLFIANNLIDEFWFFVNPVILGEGISFFPKNKTELHLNSARTFECGVTVLHYSKKVR